MTEQLTRTLLVETAKHRLREGGIGALSVRRMAAELGVTAGALYTHIESKRDLLGAVADDRYRALAARLATIESDDEVEGLRQTCLATIDFAIEEPYFFDLVMLFPPIADDPEPTEFVDSDRSAAFNQLQHFGWQAAETGRLGQREPWLTVLSPWVAVVGTLAMFRLTPWLDRSHKSAIGDLVVDAVLRGLPET